MERKDIQTVVIFGVSGFIGSNLAEFLSRDYRVIGIYCKNRVIIPNVLTFPCNILKKEEVQLILYTFRPDVVIYGVGLSSLTECAEKEELADAFNTVGLFHIVENCQRYRVQICYISSHYVFKGENKHYTEADLPDAGTVYGKNQSMAEFYLQKMGTNYIIFRSCQLYGRGAKVGAHNWFEYLQMGMKKNIEIVCDDFVHQGFIDIYYLAMALKMSFEKKTVNRLFQISTKDVMTYYQFSKLYCKVFGESTGLLSKGIWPFPFIGDAFIPKNDGPYFHMDTSNVEGFFNITVPSIKESLLFTRQRFCGVFKKKKRTEAKEGVNFI